jgi:eukaryotic-like serine/threonine-protein kinase
VPETLGWIAPSAIKVLRAHLRSRPDLNARFKREAQTISALQHAHICVPYDVGKEAQPDFLVMEDLEGETLAARSARKSLTLDEAPRIASSWLTPRAPRTDVE